MPSPAGLTFPSAPRLPLPPTRQKPWAVWVAVGLVTVLVFILLVLSAIGFWAYANHDRPELIDRPAVVNVAESACATLTRSLAATPYDRRATPAQRAAVIRNQDRAITALINEVLELDPTTRADDLPTDAWLQDWAELRAARERFADLLEAKGHAVLDLPRSAGVPITGRLTSVGLDCQAPQALARLD